MFPSCESSTNIFLYVEPHSKYHYNNSYQTSYHNQMPNNYYQKQQLQYQQSFMQPPLFFQQPQQVQPPVYQQTQQIQQDLIQQLGHLKKIHPLLNQSNLKNAPIDNKTELTVDNKSEVSVDNTNDNIVLFLILLDAVK